MTPDSRTTTARTIAAIVLIALGSLLAVIAPISAYAKHLLSNATAFAGALDEYQESPLVQKYFADAAADTLAVFMSETLDKMAADWENDIESPPFMGLDPLDVEALMRPILAEPVMNAAQVVVTTDEFDQLWTNEVRRLHAEALAYLDDDAGNDPTGPLVLHGGDMADLIAMETMRSFMPSADTPDAAFPVEAEADITIADGKQLDQIRADYQAINMWGYLLPVLAILLVATGIVVATGRRLIATAGAGLGLIAAGIASMLLARPLVTAIVDKAGHGQMPTAVARTLATSVADGLPPWQWPQIIAGIVMVAAAAFVVFARLASATPPIPIWTTVPGALHRATARPITDEPSMNQPSPTRTRRNAMPDENLTVHEATTRSSTVSQVSLDVTLDLTGEGPTFASSTTMTFTAIPGSATFIDFIAPTIESIILNGSHLDVADVYDGARITVRDLAETNTLEVTGRAAYVNTGQGLHRFVDPADGQTYLYSQFAVADCRRVFACFDQPDIKAPMALTVTAPETWTVLSNEPSTIEGTVHVFDRTPPISSYLYAIVAGPYRGVTGIATSTDGRTIPMGAYARASIVEHLDAEHIMEVARVGLAFYEREFDTPYPFTKYDQVFVPEFNIGAMEHPGCVTFTDAYVFRGRVPDSRHERRATTVLHELAHMWFGDLVTMTWWDDLWLNESFATYMSTLAMSEVEIPGHPTWSTDAWATFATSEKWWAYEQDQLPSTHPIVADIRDLEDVEVNFDGITYAKGASVLRQLVAYVGRDAFFTGVRTYFHTHAWNNTTLTDFLTQLENASGRDLTTWATQWLRSSGVNTITGVVDLSPDFDVLSFDVAQTSTNGIDRVHRMAIGLYDEVRDEAGRTVVVRTEQRELDVAGPVTSVAWLEGTSAPLFFLPNDSDLAYAKLRLDPLSWANASLSLHAMPDPLARSLIWGSAWDQVRDAQWPASDHIDLIVRNLSTETNSTTVTSLLGQLTHCVRLYTAPELAVGRHREVAAALHTLLMQAPAGSDMQIQLLLALSRHVVDGDPLATLQDMLTGAAALPGLALDTDLAWAVLTGVISAGATPDRSMFELASADAAIDAALAADPTASGELSAGQARASIPLPVAKDRAWALIADDATPNALQRHVMAGFQRVQDAHLLVPFVDPYFEQIERMWRTRSNKVAQRNVEGMYPLQAVGVPTARLVERTLSWLEEQADSRPALTRLVSEQLANATRAAAAQGI